MHGLSLSLRHGQKFSERWSGLLALGVEAAWESGAEMGDALSYSLIGGAQYQVNEELALGFGAGVFYDITDDLTALPLLSIVWEPTERWRLQVRNDVRLSYVLAPEHGLTAYLRGGYAGALGPRHFRLDGDGVLPEGSAEFSGAFVGLGFDWEPNDALAFGAYVNALPSNELEFRDRDDNQVFETEMDTAWQLGLRMTLRL